MVSEFRNEPLTDFSNDQNRAAFAAALKQVEGGLGEEFPLVVGGERITVKAKIESTNPCRLDEVIGRVGRADRELAEKAIDAAHQAFPRWSREPAKHRADLLFKGAAIMRERKHLLSATMVLETGKSWVEGDADTAEAIDFLEYYAREMLRYAEGSPVTPIPGEQNRVEYIPLGVGVVIAPWNFPLAILSGMTTAAVVAGNTVVMKPASTAPVTAYRFMEVMEEAGVPPGVMNYLPGPGGEVGDVLVDHPLTRFVCFTGSREVGVRIYEHAAKVRGKQRWLKRVIAEMGGKDAIIVDETADLDTAVEGVLGSAYGFSGQKCSACSRAIVVDAVHDAFVAKLKEKTERLTVGDTRDPAMFVGGVIDRNAFEKMKSYLKIGAEEGTLVTGGAPAKEAGNGHFIQPTIFKDIKPDARMAQEEIFGPILAVIRAADFEDALRIANGTEYGLTGSLYTRDEERMERAAREFHVGNLYFNRKCTGAFVGGHPFGGFNMSGTDSKAGGRDYLGLFLQAKTISRKA